MLRALAVVASFAASLAVSAQDPPAPAGPRDRVGERSEEMRQSITTGRKVQGHVRVEVRLANGNRLAGIVKDGRLVERVDGLRFVEAQAQEHGAGIRLWYSGGLRDYVFLPFADFAEYRVLQRLSAKQLELIEQEMQMAESRRLAEQKAAAAAAAAQAGNPADPRSASPPDPAGPAPAAEGSPPPVGQQPTPDANARKGARKGRAAAEEKPADAAEAAVKTMQAQQREWFQLLQDYPPSAGWNESKRAEIARRKVVVGAVPSAKELFFVEKFAEWQKACAFFGATAEPKAGGGGGVEPEKPPEAPEAGAGEGSGGEAGGRKKKKRG